MMRRAVAARTAAARRAAAPAAVGPLGPQRRWLEVMEITMPALSPTMEKGNLAEWKIAPGAEVADGDVLCAIETDKATNAFESPEAGFLARILVEAGAANIPVGTPIALVVDEAAGVDAPEVQNWKPDGAAPAAAAAPAAGGAFEDIPATAMRKVIAERLTQSKNVEVPHYYLSYVLKADNMLALVKALNRKGDGEFKITVNDFVVKAIARANMLVPAANTHWHGDFMRQYKGVDVSVAVATPTGLITPIIKDAHIKGLAEISAETKALAKRAREGGLMPHEYQGGTVSVSNLGGMGTQSFTAIINPPQSTIVAVGCAQPKPEIVKNADGDWEATGKIDTVINFTASFDHRVVDGAVGADWFKHFKNTFEHPLSLLL